MQNSLTDPFEILELGRGVFALILFSLSLIAWYRRRQPALIIVSIAFFLFFAKTAIDQLLPETATSGFTRLTLDFVALALFFFAIVVRPRKNGSDKTAVSQSIPA